MISLRRKSLFLFFLFVLIFSKSYAQISVGVATSSGYSTIKTFLPSSPEMTAFQVYGDVPVSYNTGVPDIKIPLGELKVGDFTWPVQLSYHAGGNKVEDLASLAGLGWTLQAGGFISSKIVNPTGSFSFDRFLNLSPRHLSSLSNTCGITPENFHVPDDVQQAENVMATGALYTPDIYYLNMPPVNTRFLIKEFEGYTVPITDNRIWFEGVGQSMVYYVLDTKGNKYTFGRMAYSYISSAGSGSASGGSGGSQSQNPTFALTRIDTYAGDFLIFEYDLHTYNYNTQGSEMRQRVPDQCTRCQNDAPNEYKDLSILGDASTSEFFITSITTSNGQRVTFMPEGRQDHPSNKRLHRVVFEEKPYSKIDSVIRSGGIIDSVKFIPKYSFELHTGYFGNAQNNNLRLKLTGLTKTGQNSLNAPHQSQQEHYFFEYNPMDLPRRMSYEIDSMGYYNGAHLNKSLLPSRSNRFSSASHVAASSLVKITYPTGGSTSFSYEINRNGWSGLRVKSITNHDVETGVVRRRSFTYGNPSINSSPFESFSSFSYFGAKEGPCALVGPLGPSTDLYSCNVISEQSTAVVTSVATFFENSLSYGEVTEFNDGEASTGQGLGGKTVYRYNTHLDFKGRTEVLPTTPMLTEKHVYKRSGGGYVQVQSEENFYEVSSYALSSDTLSAEESFFHAVTSPRDVRVFYKELETVYPDMEQPSVPGYSTYVCWPRMMLQRDFRLDLVPYYLRKTVITEYTNPVIISETIYGYDPLLVEPVTTAKRLSDGQAEVEETKYTNSDVSSLGYTTSESAAIAGLRAANVIRPVWQRKSVDGKPVYERQVYYASFPASGTQGPTRYFPQREKVKPTGGADAKQIHVLRYDSFWNPVEIQEEGNVKVSSRYNRSGELTAQCRNADYGDMAFTSFNDPEGSGFSVGPAPYENRLNPTDSYASGRSLNLSGTTIQKGGMVQGRRYILAGYWKNGSLTLSGASVIGAQETLEVVNGWKYFEWEIQATGPTLSITGGGLLDELRLFPKGSEMVTFAYGGILNLVSSGADQNGLSIFYEYDKLGRLKVVRNHKGEVLKLYEYHLKEQ